MLFYENLLLSEQLENHKDILRSVREGTVPKNVFLLCINKASKNLMDIYFSGEINKPYVKIDDLLVIAICKDKNDAKEKCAEILNVFVKENSSLHGFKARYCANRVQGDSK